MFVGGFVPQLGLGLRRLMAGMKTDIPKVHRSHGLHVLVTGFILHRRRRVRPFSYRDVLGPNGVARSMTGRHWPWDRKGIWLAVGAHPDWADVSEGIQRAKTLDECETELVRCIRRVSAASPATVGSDCMSIALSPTGQDARVRYLPNPAEDSGDVAFTPWIIGPGTIAPPTELYGVLPTLNAGYCRVEFSRIPPLEPSGPIGFSGQARRPPP
jgi:hypothetical protein